MNVQTLDDEWRELALTAMMWNCHYRHANSACVCREMMQGFEKRWNELVANQKAPTGSTDGKL